jgi:hypothetical protein
LFAVGAPQSEQNFALSMSWTPHRVQYMNGSYASIRLWELFSSVTL